MSAPGTPGEVHLTPEDRIEEDLRALSGVAHRYAGTEGEREMLSRVRSRVPEGEKTRIEGFVAYTSPSLVTGLHALALLLISLVGWSWPMLAALASALVTLSLIFEGSGRFSVIRRFLLKSASYNLVWRREVDNPVGTLVITAPLDRPRWKPTRPSWLKRPLRPVAVSGALVSVLLMMRAFAEPWGRPTVGMYVIALIVLATTVLVGGIAHQRKSKAVGGGSGCAALLELLRRYRIDPPPDVDVWMVFTGCSCAYQNGMHAFLAMRGDRLKGPIFVLALAEPGKHPLQAVVREGPLLSRHVRSTGPALMERLRWAGVDVPSIDLPGSTDAGAAHQWGVRALALRGGRGRTNVSDTLRAVEVADALCRLYVEDLHRIPVVHPSLLRLIAQGPDALSNNEEDEDSEEATIPVQVVDEGG